MITMNRTLTASSLLVAGLVGSSQAMVTFDGQNIQTDATSAGLTQLAVQDSPTQFGNSDSGTQAANGSELNALYAGLDGTSLTVSITGNLESNFNKFFLFFDAVDGGENTLAADNVDGGFNEIQSLTEMSFANGATMDHGLRFEIGSGFFGINSFDLIDNTAAAAVTGGGPGDLPLIGGSGGVLTSAGWDNSNDQGVTDTDASTALTATKGWELEIDLASLFGETPGSVGISGIITSGGGDFLSNQALPGVGSADNLGNDPSAVTLPVAVIPEPSSLVLIGLGTAALAFGHRRKA